MSQRIFKLLIVLLFISGTGCETFVEIPASKKGEALLAVRGFFHPEQDYWEVEVVPVNSLGEKWEIGATIANATVVIREMEGESIQLGHIENGLYLGDGLIPEIGKSYMLAVEAPGFSSITANSYVPMLAEDLKISFSDSTSVLRSGIDNSVYAGATIHLQFNDPETGDNFFQIFPQYKVSADTSEFSPTVFQSNHAAFSSEEIRDIISADRIVRQNYFYPYINDQTFENGQLNADLEVFRGDFYGYRVGVRAFSEDLYRYTVSGELAEEARENPLSEPVILYSNINGGTGVFAGYATQYSNMIVLGE